MTVIQLIRKLEKMPQDSEVLFVNTTMINAGAYEVTKVDDYQDGTVVLDSDYKTDYWG